MKSKKKTLILTLIAIAVLIAAVVGATYAYFAVTIAGNNNASSIIASSAQLGLIYTDGNEVNVENVIPGWTTTKTFTVQNTGDAPIDYNIIWKELLNEIQNNDLVYSITGTTTSLGETPIPLVSGPIITNIPINPGDTHEYTMTITFINRETEQNANQGKTFAGKIEINTEHMRNPATLILSEKETEEDMDLSDNAFLGSSIQRQEIEAIEFVNHKNIPASVTGSWDVSDTQDEQIMAWYEPIGSNGRYKVTIGTDGIVRANEDSSYLFNDLWNLGLLNFNNNFDTTKAIDMKYMFRGTGYYDINFTLDLGDKFETSNVTDMSYMFYSTGHNSSVFTLALGDKFDTSKVRDMNHMFYSTGYSSQIVTLNLGGRFDTFNVTSARRMFMNTGYSSPTFTLELGNNFNTSNMNDMRDMFWETGYNSTVFTLALGEKFDTSNVTTTRWMFQGCGYSSPIFALDLGEKFDTSNVTDMARMFARTGYSNQNFTLNLGNKFNMLKATDVWNMFEETGNTNPNFTIYAPTVARTYILNNSATMQLKAGTNIIDCNATEVC